MTDWIATKTVSVYFERYRKYNASSSSGLKQISENVLSPCLRHWHGTGCQKRSGIFNRCKSSLKSQAALPDTGKQDTDTHRRIADEYCGFAAVTKFRTKYFRIEFMRRVFVVRVICTLLVVLYLPYIY